MKILDTGFDYLQHVFLTMPEDYKFIFSFCLGMYFGIMFMITIADYHKDKKKKK